MKDSPYYYFFICIFAQSFSSIWETYKQCIKLHIIHYHVVFSFFSFCFSLCLHKSSQTLNNIAMIILLLLSLNYNNKVEYYSFMRTKMSSENHNKTYIKQRKCMPEILGNVFFWFQTFFSLCCCFVFCNFHIILCKFWFDVHVCMCV